MQPSVKQHFLNPTSIFFRRLAALFYDSLLLVSVFLISTLLILFVTRTPVPPQNPYYQTFLFALTFAFFVGFWCYGGQTTGMRAWRLKVISRKDRKVLNFFRGSLRFFLCLITQSCGGLGWFWIILDPDRLTLYDRLAGTRMIITSKEMM